MAELTFKSAGVATREIDLTGPTSVKPQGIPAGIIGTAEKGPAFVPVTVATFQDYLAEFGATDGERFGPLAMNEWMRYARAGTYVRVLGCGDAKKRGTTGAVTNAGFIVGGQQVQANGKVSDNPNAGNTGEAGGALVGLTAATATLVLKAAAASRKLVTGEGAVISDGTDVSAHGVAVQTNVIADFDGRIQIIFGALAGVPQAGLKDGNNAVLAGRTISIDFVNNDDVSAIGVTADQIWVSAYKTGTSNYDNAADIASVIVAVLTGEQDNIAALNTNDAIEDRRTWAQAVRYGANARFIAADTDGGDPNSVFAASVENTSCVKIALRGSQGADSGTTAANYGAWGGAWAAATTDVKCNVNITQLTKTSTGDQTAGFSAGNATSASTITVDDGEGAQVLTANVDFMVDGHRTDATADDQTLTNIAAAPLTDFTSAANLGTDTVTFTSDESVGAAGNSDTLAQTSPTNTWTVQGEDNAASKAFTDGADAAVVDAANLTPEGRAYFLGALMKDTADSTWLEDTGNFEGASANSALPIIRGMVHAASGVVLSLSCSVAAVTNNSPATNAAGTFGSGDDDGGNTWGTVETADGKQEFVMILNGFTKSDLYTNVITASFDPQSPSYFANTLNTDPTKAEEAGHYLYTHYDVRPVVGVVTGSGIVTAGHEKDTDKSNTVCAFITTSSLARNVGSTTIPNFEAFTDRFRTAETPWMISQAFGGNRHNLFTVHALDDGVYPNKKVKITIENIQRSTNDSTDFGSFDLIVRRFTDDDNNRVAYEKFRKMDVNPQSERYVGRVIGDKYAYYDFDKNSGAQKLVIEGVYPNNSKWIRVKMNPDVTDSVVPETCLPVGFRGHRHLITSGSSIMSSPTLANVITTTANKGLNRLIEPPVPFRDNITTGKTLGKKKVDSSFCWGVQFELKDDLDERNKNTKTDTGLYSYTSYYPHWSTSDQKPWEGSNAGKEDAAGTVYDSDRFNNNIFTLEQVQVLTQSSGTPDPKQWVSAEYRRDGVAKASLVDKDGVTVTNTRFLNVASDFGHLPTRKYLKFSLFLQGGFNGTNVYNEERAKLLNNAAKREMDDAANQGGTAGSTVAAYRKAIDVMEERADVDIKILAIPGLRHKSVSDYAIDAVEDRFDAMYIMDIEERDQIDNVVTSSSDSTISVTNTVTSFNNRNLDTSFAAAYFPDVVVTDPVTRSNVQSPPSVGVIGAYSLNDSVAHPWFAPAGFTRGAMGNVVESQVKLNRSNLDELYEADINPITAFPHTPGVVVFGQKTLLAGQSALDRVNVRRLLIDIRRKVRRVADTILFEPNREETLARFSSAVSPILTRIQQQQGLDRFKVVIDTTTTSQADVENNTIRGKIFLQPTRAVEFISLDFVVTNAGAEI